MQNRFALFFFLEIFGKKLIYFNQVLFENNRNAYRTEREAR